MVSYDISSLYTNIPVCETLELTVNKAFAAGEVFQGFSRNLFREYLNLAVSHTYFLFKNVLFKQKDGLSMGNPLAPTLANLFLCNLETNYLDSCPIEYRPIYYRRYLDDIFAVFNKPENSELFFNHISRAHQNIKFTMEKEVGGVLSFLDVKISRQDGKLTHAVYRKPTYTNLGYSFFAFSD